MRNFFTLFISKKIRFFFPLLLAAFGFTYILSQTVPAAQKAAALQQTAPAHYPVIYTNLMVSFNGTFGLADGVAAAFGNKFSAAVDDDDAIKLWNFDENLALVRGASTLAIEFRPVPVITDTLFYRLYLRQRSYTLKFFSQYFPKDLYLRAWLVDKYLDTKTEVNLYDTTLYNFNPNPDTNSYRNRFMLVLNRQLAATPAGVTKIINQADPGVTGVTNSITAKAGNVAIYPNPVTNGKAILQFNNMDKGSYEVMLYNATGQKLTGYQIQHSGGNNVYSLMLNKWQVGIYSLVIINKNSGKLINLQLQISK